MPKKKTPWTHASTSPATSPVGASATPRSTSFARFFPSAIKLWLLSLAFGIAASTWCSARAAAYVHEWARTVGDEVMRYARSQYFGRTQTLRINGLTFKLDVGTSSDPVPVVLEAYAARCRERSLVPKLPGLDALWTRSVLRQATEELGYVACFVADAAGKSADTLAARIEAMGPELNVSALGTLLYVTAQRRDGTTTYVAIRSEGDLPLAKAFPMQGDAPGFDPAELTRPESARRALTALNDQSETSLHVYRADAGDSHKALSRYAQLLERRGVAVTRDDARQHLRVRTARSSADVVVGPQPDGSVLFVLLSNFHPATAVADGRMSP